MTKTISTNNISDESTKNINIEGNDNAKDKKNQVNNIKNKKAKKFKCRLCKEFFQSENDLMSHWYEAIIYCKDCKNACIVMKIMRIKSCH